MNALTSVGFSGALGNRGRGRGGRGGRGGGMGRGGRGAPAASRFPQAFGQNNIVETKKPAGLPEEEKAPESQPRAMPMPTEEEKIKPSEKLQ